MAPVGIKRGARLTGYRASVPEASNNAIAVNVKTKADVDDDVDVDDYVSTTSSSSRMSYSSSSQSQMTRSNNMDPASPQHSGTPKQSKARFNVVGSSSTNLNNNLNQLLQQHQLLDDEDESRDDITLASQSLRGLLGDVTYQAASGSVTGSDMDSIVGDRIPVFDYNTKNDPVKAFDLMESKYPMFKHALRSATTAAKFMSIINSDDDSCSGGTYQTFQTCDASLATVEKETFVRFVQEYQALNRSKTMLASPPTLCTLIGCWGHTYDNDCAFEIIPTLVENDYNEETVGGYEDNTCVCGQKHDVDGMTESAGLVDKVGMDTTDNTHIIRNIANIANQNAIVTNIDSNAAIDNDEGDGDETSQRRTSESRIVNLRRALSAPVGVGVGVAQRHHDSSDHSYHQRTAENLIVHGIGQQEAKEKNNPNKKWNKTMKKGSEILQLKLKSLFVPKKREDVQAGNSEDGESQASGFELAVSDERQLRPEFGDHPNTVLSINAYSVQDSTSYHSSRLSPTKSRSGVSELFVKASPSCGNASRSNMAENPNVEVKEVFMDSGRTAYLVLREIDHSTAPSNVSFEAASAAIVPTLTNDSVLSDDESKLSSNSFLRKLSDLSFLNNRSTVGKPIIDLQQLQTHDDLKDQDTTQDTEEIEIEIGLEEYSEKRVSDMIHIQYASSTEVEDIEDALSDSNGYENVDQERVCTVTPTKIGKTASRTHANVVGGGHRRVQNSMKNMRSWLFLKKKTLM
jgi:hypothetical protein